MIVNRFPLVAELFVKHFRLVAELFVKHFRLVVPDIRLKGLWLVPEMFVKRFLLAKAPTTRSAARNHVLHYPVVKVLVWRFPAARILVVRFLEDGTLLFAKIGLKHPVG